MRSGRAMKARIAKECVNARPDPISRGGRAFGEGPVRGHLGAEDGRGLEVHGHGGLGTQDLQEGLPSNCQLLVLELGPALHTFCSVHRCGDCFLITRKLE